MNQRRRPTRKQLVGWALLWTVFVVYGSLVPLTYRPVPLDQAIEHFTHLPPLWFGLGTRADWVANILLFIPLSFLWMAALTVDKSRATELLAAAVILPAGVAAAVALEFTQIWFPRTVSRNDIVAEAIGTFAGVGAWLAVGQGFVQWLRAFASDAPPQSQVRWLLQAWLLGFLAYSVLPLDLTISFTELFHKYQSGKILLVPFSFGYASFADFAYQTLTDIIVFLPVGAWLATTFPGRQPAVVGLVGGGMLAAALEFVQLLVLSRFTDTTDVILGSLGAAIGGWLITRPDDLTRSHRPTTTAGGIRPVLPWLGAIVVFSVFLVAGFCFPPEFTHDRALIRSRAESFLRVPLHSLYIGTEFNAATQLLIRLLFFAPLGALWERVAAFSPSHGVRHFILVLGLIYSAALAIGIEIVQIFMPTKLADLTDSLLCILGAAGGLYLSNRLSRSRRTAAF